MHQTPSTIYDCEYARYVKGVIIHNKVHALDKEDNPAPAKDYLCEAIDFNMVQFHVGYYSNIYFEGYLDTSKWGYFHLSNGEIVVSPIYDYAEPFYGDRALVKLDGKYGFLDPDGSVVVDLIWDDCDSSFLMGGLCPVRQGSLWGYIDKTGTVIVEPTFETADRFERTQEVTYGVKGTHAALVKKDGKYGYLDDKGEYIFETKLDDARRFWCKGYASVMINGIWGFIDRYGEFAVTLQFEDVEDRGYFGWGQRDGVFLVKKAGQWGIMDEHLNVVMPDKGVRYVVYGNIKIYLRDGRITSERKVTRS